MHAGTLFRPTYACAMRLGARSHRTQDGVCVNKSWDPSPAVSHKNESTGIHVDHVVWAVRPMLPSPRCSLPVNVHVFLPVSLMFFKRWLLAFLYILFRSAARLLIARSNHPGQHAWTSHTTQVGVLSFPL
jgi:hypothetical protein